MAASDAFYNGITTQVDSLLARFGTTYQVRTPGGYDPATGRRSGATTRTVTGLVANQREATSLGAAGGAGVDLSWIDTKTLLLQADAAPQPGEEVEVDGTWHRLDEVVSVKPADVVVLYTLSLVQ